MIPRRLASILGITVALGFSGRVSGQCQVQKLLASDAHANDVFGHSVAVDGESAFVGQPGLGSGDGGSVYAFRRGPAGWAREQILSGSDTGLTDWFGYSLAIQARTAVVGAWSHSHSGIGGTGAVYVFELEQGRWRERQELLGRPLEAGDSFGFSVDIDGDVLVASANGHDTGGMHNAGIVYVFERRPQGWVRSAALTPADLAADDVFGSDVAVSGTTIVVGKSNDSGYRGAVYVFERTAQGWSETAKLTASDGRAFDNFGWSIDLEGDRLLVGATYADVAGCAYVFERTPQGWVERAKLSQPDPLPGSSVGTDVCLEGDTAFVGAPGVESPSPPGAVYVYRRAGGAWPFVARLSAADEIPRNAFGISLAADGETLLAGALWDDDFGPLTGAAYAFAVPEFATPYGYCRGPGNCGNADPVGGCANSTTRGARLVAAGSGSLASDDFALLADRIPPSRPVVVFRGGAAAAVPFGDGVRHVAAGNLGLRRFAPSAAGADGRTSLGPGILAGTGIAPGETWFFQAWYADPAGPCGTGFNVSNAVQAVFGP